MDVYKTAEMITAWRKQYRKPVIVDEVGYEGNIDFGWGSPARIAFLKEQMTQLPDDVQPLTLTQENHEENWDSVCLHEGEHFFLYYYGFFRPLYRNYILPAGKKYKIELIDT